MSPLRARTPTVLSAVERTNHEATAPHTQYVAVAKRLGKKWQVSCVLNGVPVDELWDTWAQVSSALYPWEYPIIGYNVIEEVIKSPDQMEGENADSPREIMSSALSEEKPESINTLAGLVQSSSWSGTFWTATLLFHGIIILSFGSTIGYQCNTFWFSLYLIRSNNVKLEHGRIADFVKNKIYM